ncbi:MAG TPA: nucleoside recognition domain-containing protein [Clostridiaceae bacterium]
MGYFTGSITAIITVIILIYGFLKGVKVYDCFIEGVKDGLNISLKIFPYILAMIVAVTVFRESNAMAYLLYIINPFVKLIGLPVEVAPLVFIKPLSGSGALGVYSEILKSYGPDSYIGRVSSMIMGSTETIFYTLTVYFGSINIKKMRHTLWAALLADLTALIMSITICRLIFS